MNHRSYKVKKSDVITCEILAIVEDKHHGTSVMFQSDNDGTFFVGLSEPFHLFKRKKPQEYADAPYDWSALKEKGATKPRPIP